VHEIQLFTQPWWELGLLCISILFILLLGLFAASILGGGKRDLWISEGILSGITNTSIIAGGIHQPSRTQFSMSVEKGFSWISVWVTRLFIAIVLVSAALYLVSQFPGFQSPFWLGIVLQGFTYGSAYLFYVSGGDDSTG
jgi:hypothetical protein